ncbi:MAG: IMP dehydrogenase, partial [Candidatus Gracilibacteria bacterium]|nr:IMP dehydrogenase [Candidatus Gracilibacteria bacterium]
IEPNDNMGTHIPLISANMNAVTGKRMAETLARYGGLGVLPQDMDIEKMLEIVNFIKSRNINFDTPLTVKKTDYVRDALGIINKRSHKCVIMVDENEKPLSIFTPSDLEKYEQFTILGNINKNFLITAKEDISPEEAYNKMLEKGVSALPIVDNEGKLVGIITKRDAVRRGLYKPTLDKNNKLNLSIALGINSFVEKARILINAGVNIFVLDTAHGYQKSMIEAIKLFRKTFGNEIVLIAGNVSTREGTKALIEAGANGVKVGIGPGAMCTTRMMTGVGRPQFSAVYHCSLEANKLGGFVVADGGVKEPRDLALAMAAGAKYAMLGTILSGTFESTGDINYDSDGFMYKQNYGMASGKAV